MKNLKRKGFTLQKLFYNNKFILVFSFFTAFIIWIIMAANGSESNPVTISDIPVIINLSENAIENDLRVFSGGDIKARINITGNRLIVGQITKDDIKIVAEQASNLITSPGNYTLELTAKKSGMKTDYEFASGVSPGFITVMVDRYREIEFTVEDQIKYSVNSEYFVGTTTLSSPKVKVSGPETEISKISKVVAKADIPGILKETATVSAPLVLYDSYGEIITSKNITVSVDKVDAVIPVLLRSSIPVKTNFENVPSGFNINNRVTLNPSNLEIAGPSDTIKNLQFIDLNTINFSDVNLKNNTFEIPIELPVGCRNLSNTASASVSVNMTGIREKTISINQFSFVNVPENKNAKAQTSSIDVLVLGNINQISLLNSNDISAHIDLADKVNFSGYTEIPVTIQIKNYSTCWAYGSYMVNVSISDKS